MPRRVLAEVRRRYRAGTGAAAAPIARSGRRVDAAAASAENLPVLVRARRDALEEAVRWGEPYLFFLAPGVVSWIVPVVDGEVVRGGVSGGAAIPEEDAKGREAAVNYLAQAGGGRRAAAAWVRALPVWPQARTGAAAAALWAALYGSSGLEPRRLVRNREAAAQQRGIAEAIHAAKRTGAPAWTFDDERALLSLLRVGDRGGARRMLNRILAAIFLRSPRVALVQARLLEMLGYLVRAAVEDNPMTEPLLGRHQRWVERLIGAGDFEALCGVMREALDDYMDGIALHGYNRRNERVRRALEYLAAHYTGRVRLADAARHAGIGPFRLAHLVKETTGKTVLQHVQGLRIEKAREWLEHTARPGAEIAYELGFTDQSHFIRQFRLRTGVTPARYRRQCRAAGGG